MKSLPEKFVSKGWGFERLICNGDLYCGKELFIARGKKFSLHLHKLKDETFYVLSGEMELRYLQMSQDTYLQYLETGKLAAWYILNLETLVAGDVFHVPVWMAHQVFAISDVTFIEFSTHHEDSDSYRLEKGD